MVLPQAVRRVIPPLLNDVISLEKDVAAVSILGPLEAFRVARAAARPARATGGDAMSTPVLAVHGVTKAYGKNEVLRGIDLEVRPHEAVALIGRL